MSARQPVSPRAAVPANDWVRPVALSCLWVSAACTVALLLVTLLAWPLVHSEIWQSLALDAWHIGMDRTVLWLLSHPVAALLLTALACALSTAASWGLLRLKPWGLWGFIALLLLTALANFVVTGWLDGVAAPLIRLLGDSPEALRSLQIQRRLFIATMYAASLALALLQGGVAWRLLRPDIRARFH